MHEESRLSQMILGAMPDGVFSVDRSFCITSFNRAAERITGYSREEVMGKPCREVFRSNLCGETCPLKESMKTGEPNTGFEMETRRKDGMELNVSVSTSVLLDSDCNFLGGVEVFRDISSPWEVSGDLRRRFTFMGMVSRSPAMMARFDALPSVAKSDRHGVIRGRPGTGRRLLAAAIHDLSPRRGRPFIHVRCGEAPPALIEEELFGSRIEGGDGRPRVRPGRIRLADGGTLLLEDAGSLPVSLQKRLALFLEEKTVRPGGMKRKVPVDVRLIASEPADAASLGREGRTSPELGAGLSGFAVDLPSLQERNEDVPLLVDHFIEGLNQRTGRRVRGATREAFRLLCDYGYPGEIRELRSIVEHAYVVCRGNWIATGDLPGFLLHEAPDSPSLGNGLKGGASRGADRRESLLEALRRHGGRVPLAAKDLGVHRTTVWRWMKRYKIG